MGGTTTGSGRSGPLLATGTLETYTPLGAFGQPVYLAHVQLKAAVRQKLGPRYADFFATPDREPGSGRIRWLADVQGPRTRWSELPPEQQLLHALSIEELRSGFARYADELRAMRTSQQAQAFVALLDTALRVPDDSHLFLVGDQPVVSFWGFSHGDGAAFDALSVAPRQPVPAPGGSPPPVPAPAAAVPRGGWRWWWLLLGLLIVLLALLAAYLLGLFDRFRLPDLGGRLPAITDSRPAPEAPPADTPAPPAPIPDPVKPDPALPPVPDPLKPALPDPGRVDVVPPVVPGGVVVPDTGTVVVPAVPGAEVRPDAVLKPVIPVVPAPGGLVPGLKAEPKAGLLPMPKADGAPNAPVPATTPGEKPAPGKTGLDNKPGADARPAPDRPPPDKPDAGKPGAADGKAPPAPQHKPLLPPLPPLGQPVKPGAELAIPPAGAGAGGPSDPAFMEGLWRSGRGLVDTVTGQPLEQYYRFDRSGQGEVVVRRQDGTECTAPAQAAMRNGVLSIDEQNNARCPDGTSIDRARTECRRLPDGRTVCTGTGSSGSTYSIGIQKGN